MCFEPSCHLQTTQLVTWIVSYLQYWSNRFNDVFSVFIKLKIYVCIKKFLFTCQHYSLKQIHISHGKGIEKYACSEMFLCPIKIKNTKCA